MKTSLQISSQKTPGTPVPRLCSETVLKYFKRKNHFKVNVWSRPSNWHINKNLQKIKSILYQDSCWINRSPWERHSCYLETPWMPDLETAAANTLDDWSWDCCCKHFGQLISRLLLRTPCTADLKTTVASTFLNWSQDCFCKPLMQLISGLFWSLLQTACMTDPETDVEKLFSSLFLNKFNPLLLRRLDVSYNCFKAVPWTDLNSLCGVCLIRELLKPVLKHRSENTLVQLI